MTPSYTSSRIDDEALAADGAETAFTLAWSPVKAGTVQVFKNGTILAETTDYTLSENADGKTVVTFTNAPLATDSVTVDYKYDNETVPVETPTLKMDIKSLPIETQARKLSAVWAFDAAYELEKELTKQVA